MSGKLWGTLSPLPGNKRQASLVRSRDRHHQVELGAPKLIQALGPVARDVDVPIGNRPDGEGVSLRREGSEAFDLVTIAVEVALEAPSADWGRAELLVETKTARDWVVGDIASVVVRYNNTN